MISRFSPWFKPPHPPSLPTKKPPKWQTLSPPQPPTLPTQKLPFCHFSRWDNFLTLWARGLKIFVGPSCLEWKGKRKAIFWSGLLHLRFFLLGSLWLLYLVLDTITITLTKFPHHLPLSLSDAAFPFANAVPMRRSHLQTPSQVLHNNTRGLNAFCLTPCKLFIIECTLSLAFCKFWSACGHKIVLCETKQYLATK